MEGVGVGVEVGAGEVLRGEGEVWREAGAFLEASRIVFTNLSAVTNSIGVHL